jgi:hypothetical protein
LIQTLIDVEWHALRLEAQAKSESGRTALDLLRLSAEYRRQFLLADRDLDRAIPRLEAVPQQPPSLNEHLARIVAERGAS